MKRKRLLIAAGAVALSILLVWGGVYVYRNAQTVNAFDEIFYSVVNPSYTETSFNRLYATSGVHRHIIPGSRSDEWTGSYIASYDFSEKRLNGDRGMLFFFHPSSQKFDIETRISYSNGDSLHWLFFYYPDTKTLELCPVRSVIRDEANPDKTTEELLEELGISKSDIRNYQDYFLYEVLLKDWVDGNKERSKFSEGNYGEFTIIDRTFENLPDLE